ncbi:hypothetical protein ACHAP7_011823 [Fusarium lateritium]
MRTPASRAAGPRSASNKLPASNSLAHIRTLTAQMERLEVCMHSIRSKLPGPTRASDVEIITTARSEKAHGYDRQWEDNEKAWVPLEAVSAIPRGRGEQALMGFERR